MVENKYLVNNKYSMDILLVSLFLFYVASFEPVTLQICTYQTHTKLIGLPKSLEYNSSLITLALLSPREPAPQRQR